MNRASTRGLVAAVALLSSGTLVACGGEGESGSGPGVDASELVSMLPAPQGDVDLIKWNVSGEPDTLDPRNAVNYGNGQIMRNLCEGILRMDEDFNIMPNLASEYEEVSPTELRLTIREGVTFWDGKPLTAEDVVYSFQRSAAEDSVVSYGWDNIASVEATGPMEVTLTFSRPDAVFLSSLATLSGVIIQKEWGEKTGDAIGSSTGGLMCTGPYELESWNAGSGITIVRNDDYWNPDLKPHAAQVEFSFVSDDSAVVRALEAGEIDGAYELPAATIQTLSDSTEGRVVFGPSTQSTTIVVARPDGPLADQKVRDALQHSVDREAIADVVFHGAADPNYTQLTPATWPNDQREMYEPAYEEWVEKRSFDLDAAKELIEESSYDGTPVVLAIVAGNQTHSTIAQLFQQQAKAIGVTVEINAMEPLVFDQASYDESAREGVDLMISTNFNSRQEPLEPLGYDLLPDNTYNYTKFDVPEVTAMYQEARSTLDKDKQAELVLQMQEIYEPRSGTISLVSNNTAMFLNDRLTGAVTSFAYWSMPQMAYVGAAE